MTLFWFPRFAVPPKSYDSRALIAGKTCLSFAPAVGVTQTKEGTMTTAAHTPGPWYVEPWQWEHGASIAIVAYGQIIATISPKNEDEEPNMHTAKRGPHDEANARLIAASPALFDAASLVIERWAAGDLADAVRMLDAAVAEAKGG